MILGTGFALARFDDVWPAFAAAAGRWLDDEAVQHVRSAGVAYATLVSEHAIVVVALRPQEDNRLRAFIAIGVGALAHAEEQIVALARDMGATSLAFRSKRRGWRRALGRHWTRCEDVYERSL